MHNEYISRRVVVIWFIQQRRSDTFRPGRVELSLILFVLLERAQCSAHHFHNIILQATLLIDYYNARRVPHQRMSMQNVYKYIEKRRESRGKSKTPVVSSFPRVAH